MSRDPSELQRYFRECMEPYRKPFPPPSFPPVEPAPQMDADDLAAAIGQAVAEVVASRPVKEKPVDPKETSTAAEAPKMRLSKKDVCKIVRASLLEHHIYQDGEIGNYNPLAAKVIVDRIIDKTGAKKGTAKGAVSRAFESLFSSARGHTEYVKACKARKPLLNWCIRESGDGKAFAVGTLDAGELASESELQSRVEFRE